MRSTNQQHDPRPRWFRATVGRQAVGLASKAESDRVKRACITAVRRGGGIVRFHTAREGWTDFLITPGLAVSFDEFVLPDEQPMSAAEMSANLVTGAEVER